MFCCMCLLQRGRAQIRKTFLFTQPGVIYNVSALVSPAYLVSSGSLQKIIVFRFEVIFKEVLKALPVPAPIKTRF